jgi:hypothetical protein
MFINWSTVGAVSSASVTAITALTVAYIAVAQFFINRRQYRLASLKGEWSSSTLQ